MRKLYLNYVARFFDSTAVNATNHSIRVMNLKGELDRTFHLRDRLPTFGSNYGEPVLLIKSLIDKIDVDNIYKMCRFVKANHPDQCLDRQFKNVTVNYVGDEMIEVLEKNEYGGGNEAVFIEGHMQEILPSLLEHILTNISEAAVLAKWHPYPRQLGIRCIESLVYYTGGKLLMHKDSDSIFTIVIMLSDTTSDFTGGEFVIAHGNSSIRINLNQGEAIMFDSNSFHGVDSITTGTRNVLVLELWPFDDAIKGDCRPSVSRYKGRHKVPIFLRGPQ